MGSAIFQVKQMPILSEVARRYARFSSAGIFRYWQDRNLVKTYYQINARDPVLSLDVVERLGTTAFLNADVDKSHRASSLNSSSFEFAIDV
jgi:hypothetical protein